MPEEEISVSQELQQLAERYFADEDEVSQQLKINAQLLLERHLEAARDDLLRSAAKRLLRQRIIEDKPTGDLALTMAVKQWGKDAFIPEKRGRKAQTTKKFITIGAKDNIDVHKFWKQMEKCKNKAKLAAKTGMYVLEQRSEGEQEPYGWHIHWLVDFEATSSPAIVVQQVYQCFQKYLAASNYVDVKDVPDDHWDHKKMYIEGQKTAEKMMKVQKDVVLRNKLNIPHKVVY